MRRNKDRGGGFHPLAIHKYHALSRVKVPHTLGHPRGLYYLSAPPALNFMGVFDPIRPSSIAI